MAKKNDPEWPRVVSLARMPDLGGGLCQGRTWLPADAWLSDVPHVANAARWMCGRCPVLEACREWALTLPPYPGVIGGTTQADRNRIRRRAPEPERPDAPRGHVPSGWQRG